MSNHWGSYMLNDALEALDNLSVLKQVGREKTQQIIAKFLRISDENDGNRSEVLVDIGERLHICYSCAKYSDRLEDGLCPECWTTLYGVREPG